jgi:hypothetical protein
LGRFTQSAVAYSDFIDRVLVAKIPWVNDEQLNGGELGLEPVLDNLLKPGAELDRLIRCLVLLRPHRHLQCSSAIMFALKENRKTMQQAAKPSNLNPKCSTKTDSRSIG